MYYTWKNIKKSYKNNKFKISASRWNEKFGLTSRWYIQDYFEYNFKKHGEKDDNSPIRIFAYKIENKITFNFKRRYCLELLCPETMK